MASKNKNKRYLAELLKKQIELPQSEYDGDSPFSDYVDMNPLFFSKLETLEENEKTAYLLSCLNEDMFRYLKLSQSNKILTRCKYSDLVEELNKYSAETKKYASEYSKLLSPKMDYPTDMKYLHIQKVAEWKSLENAISQKIPDMVKVLLLYKDYKEPFKSVAEKYIQNNHSDIKLSDFIKHMESETLFLK